MKDYSSMSDFEINKQVALKLGLDWSGVTEENRFFYQTADYCNNPADAWQIIISKGISLSPCLHKNEWLAAKFKPTRDNSKPHEIELYYADRPLRAAMIVFLQMME